MGDEGRLPFLGYETWYRVEGVLDGDRPPLVVLHGGPGLPHGYLEPLARLASAERAVVFYDQLGCGNSDRPAEDGLWTMSTFVQELDAVRAHLGLGRFHLLGHSWGGWLALEYVLDRRPPELASLVLASTCASVPAFAAVTRALKERLPPRIQQILDHHEAAGTTDDPRYRGATLAYVTQWLIRNDFPEALLAARAGQNEHVTALMHGPEWNVTGRLKDWDATDRLAEIRVPTLVTSGRHDEMTPELVEELVAGLPDATWHLLEGSAHLPHLEEEDAHLSVVESFLAEHDGFLDGHDG